MTEPVIVQPDKTLRRRLLWVILIAALAAGGAVMVLEDYLDGLTVDSDDPEVLYEQLQTLVTGFLVSASAVALMLVIWLLWTARRILKAGQFPLPGQRVLRPTPLRTGPAARRLAWSLVVIGLALVILHALLIYYFLYLLQSLQPL